MLRMPRLLRARPAPRLRLRSRTARRTRRRPPTRRRRPGGATPGARTGEGDGCPELAGSWVCRPCRSSPGTWRSGRQARIAAPGQPGPPEPGGARRRPLSAAEHWVAARPPCWRRAKDVQAELSSSSLVRLSDDTADAALARHRMEQVSRSCQAEPSGRRATEAWIAMRSQGGGRSGWCQRSLRGAPLAGPGAELPARAALPSSELHGHQQWRRRQQQQRAARPQVPRHQVSRRPAAPACRQVPSAPAHGTAPCSPACRRSAAAPRAQPCSSSGSSSWATRAGQSCRASTSARSAREAAPQRLRRQRHRQQRCRWCT
jgi:hypothetical protein